MHAHHVAPRAPPSRGELYRCKTLFLDDFPTFFLLSKWDLDPPTHFQIFFWIFLTLQSPLAHVHKSIPFWFFKMAKWVNMVNVRGKSAKDRRKSHIFFGPCCHPWSTNVLECSWKHNFYVTMHFNRVLAIQFLLCDILVLVSPELSQCRWIARTSVCSTRNLSRSAGRPTEQGQRLALGNISCAVCCIIITLNYVFVLRHCCDWNRLFC